ncbi:MAG: acetyl-CoA carboxylase biotin carboxyl carrier protein subunit [Chloroflexi bacterium]|nr:acetyl-CoA carboxylase biotin carboxyl carrier protein subunit [Chloroflexota bacterium]
MEYRLKLDENMIPFKVQKKGDHGVTLSQGNRLLEVDYTVISSHHLHLLVNGLPVNAYLARDGNTKTVIIRGIPYFIGDGDSPDTRTRGKKRSEVIPQEITPPMPAVVVRIQVLPGDRVKQGESVIVVESMKMETTLTAPSDGRVRAVNVAVGDKVMPGQILVDIDRDAAASTQEESRPG